VGRDFFSVINLQIPLIPAQADCREYFGKSRGILFSYYACYKGATIRGILNGSYMVPNYSAFQVNKAYRLQLHYRKKSRFCTLTLKVAASAEVT
jgi:hypothetical protein